MVTKGQGKNKKVKYIQIKADLMSSLQIPSKLAGFSEALALIYDNSCKIENPKIFKHRMLEWKNKRKGNKQEKKLKYF